MALGEEVYRDHGRQGRDRQGPADWRRLDEVKLEERNLIREIAKLGTSEEFYEVLRELREEKTTIQARIDAGRPEWSPASLEKPVRAAISQIESLLQASPEKAHLALEKLLSGNRITVHQSPDSRDYNIEGTAELTLEAHTAGRPETTGRMLSVVAGGRFATDETGSVAPMPYRLCARAAAPSSNGPSGQLRRPHSGHGPN